MPSHRKSCNSCFLGRRKCDLTYPTCHRCQKNNKSCYYASSPSITDSHAPHVASGSNPVSKDNLDSWSFDTSLEVELSDNMLMGELLYPSIPNQVGQLGKLEPISGNTQSWQWVMDELKGYPRAFAQTAATEFIHKDLFQDKLPPRIRVAFGICAAYACMNEANQSMLFQTIDAEVSELVAPVSSSTLLEDLSKLQALVLYQIIRLFHGEAKQRSLAEQQQGLLGTWGLRLLQRTDTELQTIQPNWEAWILAESVRRTVIVAFMANAVHSIFKNGICPELPTLSLLPMSNNQTFWNSRAAYLLQSREDVIVKYSEFTALWLAYPYRKLEPFEKMVIVACKGLEPVQTLSLLNE